MRFRVVPAVVLAVVAGGLCAGGPVPGGGAPPAQGTNAAPGELTIVQWNVENLFDAEDDPANEGDDEFTPQGWRRWTPGRYQRKIENLASVLSRLNADVVCLEEVENRRVLDDLCEALRRGHGKEYPFIVHREGGDHRGIDVALLANRAPAEQRWIAPVPLQRDIAIVRFTMAGRSLTVLVNHWKSNLGEASVARGLRTEEARSVRAEVERLRAADPQSAILVVGDFNVDFDDDLLLNVLGSGGNRRAAPAGKERAVLWNLHADLAPADRGTLYFARGRRWNSFDSMHASGPMVEAEPRGGWKVKPGSYEVFRADDLKESEEGSPKPFRTRRNRETGKTEYVYGYSDHFPVRVTLSFAGGGAP